jgi:hypothetical protein
VEPLTVTALIFWSFIASTLALLAIDRKYLQVLTSDWRVLGGVIALTILWRLPPDGQFFHGLEYEDSYVYSVVAKAMALGVSGPQNGSYLTSVCSIGSLLQCAAYETYSGHYIGFPFVVSLINRLLGFSVYNASILGVMASVVSATALWCLAQFVGGRKAAIAATIIFAVTPVFAVYGVAAFAEPTSNALATVAMAIGVRMLNGRATSLNGSKLVLNATALTLTLLMAVLVKRENAVIPAVFALVAAVWWLQGWRHDEDRPWSSVLVFVCCTLAVAYFAFTHLRLSDTVVSETAEYGQNPFAFNTMRVLMPMFASAFIKWEWYQCGAWLAALGVVVCIARRRADSVSVLLCGAAYLFLYLSHVRSHYMLVYGDVSDRDALRYSMNLMSLWSALAGVGAAGIVESIFGSRVFRPGILKGVVAVLAVLLGVDGYWHTRTLRREAIEDELLGRINPARTAIETIGTEAATAYVISPESLIIQLYGPPTLRVVDFTVVNSEMFREVRAADSGARIWYVALRTYDNDADHRRYREQFAEIETNRKEHVQSDERFDVFRLVQ